MLDSSPMAQTAEKFNPVPETLESRLGQFCKAAGDDLRLQILRALARDSFGVTELCEIFSTRQPAMSHHLKVLADAGLLSRRREGNSIFYRRSHFADDDSLAELFDKLMTIVDQVALSQASIKAIAKIHAQRGAASKAFFAANSAKLNEHQELIATPTLYSESLLEIVDGTSAAKNHWLELGPGQGWLLPEMARRCDRVSAIDNSASMLDAAKTHCAEQGAENIAFICGDSNIARNSKESADLIITNMVLHHNPSPAVVISDLASSLSDNGYLLISDLMSHDQSWTIDVCGDLWLGFDTNDLHAWCRAAGLHPIASAYLSLRSGFQIQIQTYQRNGG